jgi:anti-anti-sigma regulatory factor
MLKITQTAGASRTTVKLEGALKEPWVAEVRRACLDQQDDSEGRALALDLADVTFVDAAGRELLATLLSQGASIAACSNFVAELLHLARP